ncbi:signal recognition particle, SRP19 subunit [Xylaria bambusicola]|uniref:signal recognition particle, SRP19 subunit n=1 Tax=Xylaria bambusicola TaxID=326684 RepID=UPI00200875DA|nr:signal recognition particle, SRP19 subunit [Xylaria bambusicola]KAI0518357.1 signal recognition particle, SRP19 subunit [Xylaria bambusicola]
MSHARIEEVSDSDDDVSDPSEGDIDDFKDSDILRAVPSRPAPSSSSSSQPQTRNPPQQQHTSQQAPQPGLQPNDIKDYQMLYPVYFDATRTRAEGRRVPANLAVKNPLAREIANACAALRLSPVFEAHRTHPKDWANPGRVRVALKEARARNHPVKNKHHLYVVVAKYLQEHPTTDDSPALRQGMRGLGLGSLGGAGDVYADGKPWPRSAVPKGWKMGELLPAYSAAMTGGGVSENAFKDMMREMQGGGGPGGMPGMPGMPGMNADMMSMLQNMGMGGGGGGPAIGGSEGGGKKGKKGKR